jgi:hypothetical protein
VEAPLWNRKSEDRGELRRQREDKKGSDYSAVSFATNTLATVPLDLALALRGMDRRSEH